MRTLTLKCAIVSGKRPLLNLQDVPVSLKQKSGTTSWSGSAPVTLDDTLKIDASFVGIEDSPWSIDITMDCAAGEDPAKIFHDEGKIPNGGGQGISTKKVVSAAPCAKPQVADTAMKLDLNVASPEKTPAKKQSTKKSRKKTLSKKIAAKRVPKKPTTS